MCVRMEQLKFGTGIVTLLHARSLVRLVRDLLRTAQVAFQICFSTNLDVLIHAQQALFRQQLQTKMEIKLLFVKY